MILVVVMSNVKEIFQGPILLLTTVDQRKKMKQKTENKIKTTANNHQKRN